MKRFIAGASVLAAVVVLGCSTMSVKYDFDDTIDFKQYKSYNWIEKKKSPRMTTLTDKRIKTAVEDELNSKGFVMDTTGNPDLLISYQAIQQKKVDVTNYPYGYWRGYGGSYTRVDQYNEGTLVLDVVDPELNQLVWRGWATSAIGDDPSREQALIREAANKILKKFPPK